MASDGWDMVVTARRENLLNNLADELRKKHRCRVTVIPKDLSLPGNADELFREVGEMGIAIDALVNNAGFGRLERFVDSEEDVLVSMMNLNIVSLTRLTRLFLPGMIERRSGWIMNVGSVAGFMPLPIFGVYAATKAYVLLFTEALDAELKGTGVSATCLAPGPTKTGFGKVAGRRNPEKAEFMSMTPDHVARLGYRGMMARKRLVVTGVFNRMMTFSPRFLPRKLLARAAFKVLERRI